MRGYGIEIGVMVNCCGFYARGLIGLDGIVDGRSLVIKARMML